MWFKIDKEAYMKWVAGLKPHESFSDPEGTSPLGNGRPFMHTVWGNEFGPIVKCDMSREHRDAEWVNEYFLFVPDHERIHKLEVALTDLIAAVPKQTEDADWWGDDLRKAVENAEAIL